MKKSRSGGLPSTVTPPMCFFQAEIGERDPGAVGILELKHHLFLQHLYGSGVCALARWTLACPVCELLAEAQHLLNE